MSNFIRMDSKGLDWLYVAVDSQINHSSDKGRGLLFTLSIFVDESTFIHSFSCTWFTLDVATVSSRCVFSFSLLVWIGLRRLYRKMMEMA